jgi:hypothetical protein
MQPGQDGQPAEDGHGESPSSLVSFRTGYDFDPEKSKPCADTREKQQENDPE